MADWEKIILGVGALIFIFFYLRGAQSVIEQSRKAENKDWGSVVLILGIVSIFVMVLVIAAKS